MATNSPPSEASDLRNLFLEVCAANEAILDALAVSREAVRCILLGAQKAVSSEAAGAAAENKVREQLRAVSPLALERLAQAENELLTALNEPSEPVGQREKLGQVRALISKLAPSDSLAASVASAIAECAPSDASAIRHAVLRTRASKDALTHRLLPLIEQTAAALSHQGVSQEDLIQEGSLGLIEALTLPRLKARHGSVEGYLRQAIRSPMEQLIAAQASAVALPVEISRLRASRDEIRRRFLALHGREPTEEELRDLTRLESQDKSELPKDAEQLERAFSPVSLSDDVGTRQTVDDRGEAHLTVSDLLATKGEDAAVGGPLEDVPRELNPEAVSDRSELVDTLRELIGTRLTEREQSVLAARFGLRGDAPKTLEELGQTFGLTRERIRQLEAQALAKLKRRSLSQKLDDFIGSLPELAEMDGQNSGTSQSPSEQKRREKR